MYLKDILKKAVANKKVLLILAFIMLMGIFLRAYRFQEFQRFDEDHVRDAQVIAQMDVDRNFIIMGPIAKYTSYHLGPMYYYFEYITFKLFGDAPGNLAYPSLLFSILSIPLLYVVLKKYFSQNITLTLTAIYSVSFNSIEYARFEWNCNLIPFFALAFIYLVLKMLAEKERPRWWGVLLTGIVIGIGVQLHTMITFLFFPIIALYFIMMIKKKYPFWKSFLVITLSAVFLNTPAIIWDSQHSWINTQSFMQALIEENVFTKDFPYYLASDLKCYAQGNTYVLSAFNQTSSCEIFNKQSQDSNGFYVANLVLTLLFFSGGIVLLVVALRREESAEKKSFLQLGALYFVLTIIIFLPMVYSFDKRYFIVAFFSPYLFLGLWMKFIMEKLRVVGVMIVVLIFSSLVWSNYSLVNRTFISNPDQFREENEYCGINLLVTDEISKKIMKLAKEHQSQNIYISTPLYMRGYRCVIEYFVHKNSDITTNSLTKSERNQLEKDAILFFVQPKDAPDPGLKVQDYIVLKESHGETYDILMLKKIN